MKKPSEKERHPEGMEERLIGLGERSFRKNYYPELQLRLDQLERFRSLVDHANDLILLVELVTGQIVDANEAACRQAGYAYGALDGMALEAVLDLERLDWPDDRQSGHGLPGKGVITSLHRREGADLAVEATLSMDDFGGTDYLVVVARDISERLQAQSDLKSHQVLLHSVLNHTDNAILALDGGRRVVYYNEQYLKLYPFSRAFMDSGPRVEDLIHRACEIGVYPPAQADELIARRLDHLRQAEEKSIIETPRLDGTLVEGFASLLPGGGYLLCFRDVTKRRRAEEALRASDRMKTDFITTAAHELRTPLTSIRGFSQVLLEQKELPPGEQHEFLRYINEKAVTLDGLVDDLLDIVRIESGQQLALRREPVSVRQVVEQAVPLMRSAPQIHRFEVDLEAEEAAVDVDKGKIGQVLENLLSNAVKYSPGGGKIRIAGRCEGGWYQLSITDRGIGMTEEQVARVFDKFYRVDATDTAVGGIGLGMSIVKNIVEGHGGRIRVESEPGRGTAVRFTLPLAAARKAETEERNRAENSDC